MNNSKTSRRLLLAGLVSTVAGAQLKGDQLELMQVIVDPAQNDGKAVPLQTTDMVGSGQTIGYMVGCPQDCAKNHNNGQAPDATLYVSPEWMMEIIYTAKEGDVLAAMTRYKHRIQNAPNAKGCGRISMNAYVTEVKKNGSDWYEVRKSNLYYALTPNGGKRTPDTYVPPAVWISTEEWDRNNTGIKAIVKDIKDHLPANPTCT